MDRAFGPGTYAHVGVSGSDRARAVNGKAPIAGRCINAHVEGSQHRRRYGGLACVP